MLAATRCDFQRTLIFYHVWFGYVCHCYSISRPISLLFADLLCVRARARAFLCRTIVHLTSFQVAFVAAPFIVLLFEFLFFRFQFFTAFSLVCEWKVLFIRSQYGMWEHFCKHFIKIKLLTWNIFFAIRRVHSLCCVTKSTAQLALQQLPLIKQLRMIYVFEFINECVKCKVSSVLSCMATVNCILCAWN